MIEDYGLEMLKKCMLGELLTGQEWLRLPLRTRMLIAAGYVDTKEVIRDWQKRWREEEVK